MTNHNKPIADTVCIDSSGAISSAVKGSYRRGTEQLLDLFHAPVHIRPMAVQDITRMSFGRAGQALKQALGRASERRGK